MVCGPRGAGKTSYLQDLAADRSDIHGVISLKAMRSGAVMGYDAAFLPTPRRVPLLRRGARSGGIGRYREVPGGFALACAWLDRGIEDCQGTLVVDEVGLFEVQGGGFAAPLRRILALPGPLVVYLGIRSGHVDSVVEAYGLGDYRTVEIAGKEVQSENTSTDSG